MAYGKVKMGVSDLRSEAQTRGCEAGKGCTIEDLNGN